MELRIQKGTCLACMIALWVAPSLLAQRELRFEARHHHWHKYGTGILVLGEQGVSFEERAKNKPNPGHSGRWDYQHIQQLYLSHDRLVVLTYKDRKWRLGIDKQYSFTLAPGQTFDAAYSLLKNHLDQRFVAALADERMQPVWQMPVKLLGRITGSEGVLEVGSDRLVYKTDQKEQSRTWRYEDVENISSSGPFQLTLTSYERAKTHYGSLKGFNFQLKQALDEKRFNLLWRRLNQSKGLELLSSIQEGEASR